MHEIVPWLSKHAARLNIATNYNYTEEDRADRSVPETPTTTHPQFHSNNITNRWFLFPP